MNVKATLRTFLGMATLLATLATAAPAAAQTDRVLVPGDPPLYESTVIQVYYFFAWLSDEPLTQTDYVMLRTTMMSEWYRHDPDTIQGTYMILQIGQQVSTMSPAEAAQLRAWLKASLADASDSERAGAGPRGNNDDHFDSNRRAIDASLNSSWRTINRLTHP